MNGIKQFKQKAYVSLFNLLADSNLQMNFISTIHSVAEINGTSSFVKQRKYFYKLDLFQPAREVLFFWGLKKVAFSCKTNLHTIFKYIHIILFESMKILDQKNKINED